MERLMSLRGFMHFWDSHLWGPVLNPNAWEAEWSHAQVSDWECKQPEQTHDWSFSKAAVSWREVNEDHGSLPGEGPRQSWDWRIFEDIPILLPLSLHPLYKQDFQEERQGIRFGSETWMPIPAASYMISLGP